MRSPECVRCGSRRHVITSGTTPHAWFCHVCRIEFEPPETDGMSDTPYGDPAKIAADREFRALREKAKRCRK